MNLQDETWKKDKAGYVSASRIADVLAKGRNGAPSLTRAAYLGDIVAERLSGEFTEGFTSADMRRGLELEPFARAAYEARTGELVDQVGFIKHPTIEWAGCSPDGLVLHNGLTEYKCPKNHVHIGYLLGGKAPTEYQPQMLWQMACTEREWDDFVSYNESFTEPLNTFVVRFFRDDKRIAEMEAEVRRFLAEVEETLERLRKLAA